MSLEGAQGWIMALFAVIKSIIIFDLLIPLSTYRVVITISVEHKTCQKKFKQAFEAKWKGISSMDTMVLIVVHSLSHVWLFATPWTAHARLPCPSLSPGICSNWCPLSQWCHPTILSSVIPFSSRPQSFAAWGIFPMSQFFASGGQSIGASASAFSMTIQSWFYLGLIGLILWLLKA